ncbi:hypothetical protein SLEP1_g35660 [Rubroshorea leprosula]|uniref:Uncharacterized protein n=1 Tax=Rubroshorea leprosula TaxID=152421 RepID=A0AAV5KPC9_9ROSI|nr:hypothetical protein SLEP1_g35660 [Rubroshorea leprosula]
MGQTEVVKVKKTEGTCDGLMMPPEIRPICAEQQKVVLFASPLG